MLGLKRPPKFSFSKRFNTKMLIFSFRNELMMIIKDLKEEFFFIKANKESRGDKTHFFERKNLCSGMGCLFYEMQIK